jgi:hypothetical protein
MAQEQPSKNSGGYGKRPMWQWILLYIIVGAAVYGFIYYFFIQGSLSNNGLY